MSRKRTLGPGWLSGVILALSIVVGCGGETAGDRRPEPSFALRLVASDVALTDPATVEQVLEAFSH